MNKTNGIPSNLNTMKGAGSSNSNSNTNSSSNANAANSNYYYGFNTNNNSKPDNEINGGGLSFVVHSSSHNNHQNNQNQNLPSISSVASNSSSSGISSGSSTITKSSGFNGNTFTRSKPKERKPLPNKWSTSSSQEIDDQDQKEEAEADGQPKKDGSPFLLKGKGPIPSVVLSEATPSPRKPQRQNNSGDLYYFNTSNSNSSGDGSVILARETSGNGNNNSGSRTFSNDQSLFQPQACSTFILTEGEDFPSEIQEGGGGGDDKSKIISKNISGRKISKINGVRKMKGDVSEKRLEGLSKEEASSGSNGTSGSSDNSEVLNSNGANSNSNGLPFVGGGEEENFECFGDGSESFTFQESASTTSGSGEASLQYSRDGTDLELLPSSGPGGAGGVGGPSTPLSRNSWTRTSLRKSPQNSNNSPSDAMGYRRWGSFRNAPGTKRTPPAVTSSNALANQLYRSSSFHSSGRSSAGDAEEMYSDGSLEDEVLDLTHKVHHLEEKMNVLAENQNDADDRYTREKEKNAELSTKVFMLEEQLRETELRGDEKLKEEQRRFKEFQSRWDREKQLQSENYEIRLLSMEKDLNSSKSEGQRQKGQLERERNEKETLSEKLFELERELGGLREENRCLLEEGRRDREQMGVERREMQREMGEAKRELENLRIFQMQNSPSSLRSLRGGGIGGEEFSLEEELIQGQELKGRVKEAEEEIRKLKRMNKQLQDANDELNAQLLNRGLEEGRTLLTTINSVPAGNSLAAEFEAMSTDQTALGLYADSEMDLAKVKKALKEQIEVNEQLRSYIDGILLIIVENNPQLLEVKNHSSSTSTSNGTTSKTSIANPNCNVVAPPPTEQQPQSKVNFSNGLAKISFGGKNK